MHAESLALGSPTVATFTTESWQGQTKKDAGRFRGCSTAKDKGVLVGSLHASEYRSMSVSKVWLVSKSCLFGSRLRQRVEEGST